MAKTRILLTGAGGFLGKACRSALDAESFELVTTDRQGDVQLRGDLADAGFIAGLPPVDVVVHAAAVQYVSADLPLWSREAYFKRNNVDATQALVARYRDSDVHFVNVGTSMMYRQDGSPSYSPSSPMQGQGVYSRSKLVAQQAVAGQMRRWATIIPCIIGGPGREGLFRAFVRSIQTKGSVTFPGPGNAPVHMVHVDDVAGLIRCVVMEHAQGFFNAGAPGPLTITQWVEEIAAELKLPAVRIRRLPLVPIKLIASLSGYRALAREQLLMLQYPHVLDLEGSLALGWRPQRNNSKVVRDIARYVAINSAA